MTDLKPCPFCGSLNITEAGEGYLYCADCEAEGPNGSADEQRDNWNTRPVPELPEGYSEQEGGNALFSPIGELVAYREVPSGRLRLDIVESSTDEVALAIWLQRRSK